MLLHGRRGACDSLHVIAFFCVIPIQREVEVNGCDGMKQNSFQPPAFRSQARLRLTAGQVTPWDFFPDPANGISDSFWPGVAQDKGHACEVTGLPPGTGTQCPRGRLVHSPGPALPWAAILAWDAPQASPALCSARWSPRGQRGEVHGDQGAACAQRLLASPATWRQLSRLAPRRGSEE